MARISLAGMKRLALAAALLSLVTACGGDGSGTRPPVTVVAPAVTTVTTDTGAGGVFLNSAVAVTFSEAMDPSSFTAATFSLTTGGSAVAGTIGVNGATAVFRPSAPLSPSTTYLLTVTTGVRSLAGVPLGTTFSRSLTTGTAADTTAPIVVSTIPASNTTVLTANTVTVTFNKAIDLTTVTAASFSVAGGGSIVPGSFAMNGTQVIFRPSASLRPNTTFQVTVGVGVRDLAGNPLASPFIFSFTTGAASPGGAPRVLSVTPVNGATGVAVSTAVTATFSTAVDPSTVTGTTFTLTSSAGAVGGTVAVNGAVATFQPAASLATGTTYTATVTTGVKDTVGTPLSAPFTWSFTTSGSAPVVAPVVTAVLPPAGSTGVATNTALTITFDRAMDPASFTAASVTLTGPAGAVTGTVSLSGSSAVFAPSANLSPSTLYTAMVAAGVKDTFGTPLAAPFSWSFTTGTGPVTTPPTVIATTPVNGAVNVSVTAPGITATFSKAMDPATINQLTFTLSFSGVPVQGTVVLNGTTATFTPVGPLQAATLFTATITTGALDLTGVPLSAPFSWSFATQ